MAKTREIRKRIQSVRNIHKITATMEKVAQSKGMKLSGRSGAATSFRAHLLRLLPEVLGVPTTSIEAGDLLRDRPLCEQRSNVRSVLLVGITSSRGLCGGYNARVIQATRGARVEELRAAGTKVMLAIVGKKGLAYFRYHAEEGGAPDLRHRRERPVQPRRRVCHGHCRAIHIGEGRYGGDREHPVQVEGLTGGTPRAVPPVHNRSHCGGADGAHTGTGRRATVSRRARPRACPVHASPAHREARDALHAPGGDDLRAGAALHGNAQTRRTTPTP